MMGVALEVAARPAVDRRGGLVACGLVLLLLSGFCALVAALSALLTLLPKEAVPGMGGSLRTALPGVIMYGLLAVALAWLGVGLIRARRWARALALVVAWVWLLSGLVSLGLMGLVWAPTRGMLADIVGLPQAWTGIFMIGVTLILLALHVALPALLVLFLGRADVQATCALCGPKRQWADDLSPHALSLGLLYLIGALSVAVMPLYGLPFPVFTVLLKGSTAWGAELLLAALCLWLVAATLSRRPAAWWVALTGSLVAAGSTITSSLHFTVAELLAASSLGPQEMALLQVYAALQPSTLVWIWGLSWLSMVAYLMVVRRQVSKGRATADPV